MHKIKIVFWLIIILVVAYFVSMNTQPLVSVNLLPEYKTKEYPLALVIVASMVVGAFIVLLFTVIDWISYKIEKRKLKKLLQECEKEKSHLKDEVLKLQGEIEALKEEKIKGEEDGALRQGLHEGKEEKQPDSKEAVS